MADPNKSIFDDSDHLLDQEDEQTLAAIDRAVKSADEGRLVTAEEARRRFEQWSTKSSTPKTRQRIFESGAAMPRYDRSMTTTLSVRIDPKTKRRLESLARRSRRSQSALAAEAITAFTDSEHWRRNEILAGKRELDAGKEVSHDKVSGWLRSWGQPGEGTAPR